MHFTSLLLAKVFQINNFNDTTINQENWVIAQGGMGSIPAGKLELDIRIFQSFVPLTNLSINQRIEI